MGEGRIGEKNGTKIEKEGEIKTLNKKLTKPRGDRKMDRERA